MGFISFQVKINGMSTKIRIAVFSMALILTPNHKEIPVSKTNQNNTLTKTEYQAQRSRFLRGKKAMKNIVIPQPITVAPMPHKPRLGITGRELVEDSVPKKPDLFGY